MKILSLPTIFFFLDPFKKKNTQFSSSFLFSFKQTIKLKSRQGPLIFPCASPKMYDRACLLPAVLPGAMSGRK